MAVEINGQRALRAAAPLFGLVALWSSTTVAAAGPPFIDATQAAGLDFVHFNGMSGEHYFAEMMGAGAAMFDYDNDGDLDLYLVQGTVLGPGKAIGDGELAPPDGPRLDRLYRNDSAPAANGRMRLRFTDVTAASGIEANGYGMGVASGDFDRDGWTDLYITNFGANQLWRNNGDGTFSDLTAATHTGDAAWSVSATFVDFDRDGWLDLFVGNYVNFSMDNHKPCHAPSGTRDYCSPSAYQPTPDRLYRNRGDGRFEDVSANSGIATAYGGALGVVSADFNLDGQPDIYVANDGVPNQMWINQGDGHFINTAFEAGAAVNRFGGAEASMGVDAADFDGDGDPDLFMTHLLGESNTLYVNDGTGYFEDRTMQLTLAATSRGYTSFGTRWIDYDNDGRLDLFVANGGVVTDPSLAAKGDVYPLHQTNQLFQNTGEGFFEDISAYSGAVFQRSEVSRGAAFGDLDNDGDTDILLTNNNGPARLLLNQVGADRPWLGLRLLSTSGHDAIGARLRVLRSGRPDLWRRAHTDGSYASASDPRILVGLGDQPAIEKLVVYWPGGRVEQWAGVPIRRYSTLREGTGQAVAAEFPPHTDRQTGASPTRP